MAELWNTSPFECLSRCVTRGGPDGYGCISVVYHRHFSSCQLYAHNGTYEDARLVFASGHDYYKRIGYDGFCKEKQPPINGYLQPRPRIEGILQVATEKAIVLNEVLDLTHNSNYANEINKENVSHSKKLQEHELLSNPLITSCRSNYTLAYFLFENYKASQSVPSAIIKGINRRNCINLCSLNMNQHSEPIACSIVSYNKTGHICKLYDSRSNGIKIQPNEQHDYSEKLCLPRDVGCAIGATLKVYPKKEVNHVALIIKKNIDKLQQCVTLCHKNLWCQSITYKNKECKLFNVKIELCLSVLVDADDETITVSRSCNFGTRPKVEFASVCEYNYFN
uniref:Apple domain-containing protein n=1 Tax=Acrobeloides nanus TaxID=290746 RepID=A0A914DCV9_9BILA